MNLRWTEAPEGRSSSVQLGERKRLSARFLLQTVAPRVAQLKQGETLTDQELNTLLQSFKQENQGLGDDFEMSHVQSHALFLLTQSAEDIKKMWPNGVENLPEVLERTVDIITGYGSIPE